MLIIYLSAGFGNNLGKTLNIIYIIFKIILIKPTLKVKGDNLYKNYQIHSNKNLNESQWTNNLFISYKSFDRLLCIMDCTRFEYCNLIIYNQINNNCKYYFIDSFNQYGLIDSQGMSLFYVQPNNSLKLRINCIYQEFNYLTSNSSNINKTTLTFYEFKNLQRQNAYSVTFQGSATQMALITSRRIYFSNGNWYWPFYMPSWPKYGEILYIEVEVDSGYSVKINKARTNQSNDLIITTGYLAMFVNDLFESKFIGSMNKTIFLASFN